MPVLSPQLLREIGEAYPGGQRGLARWLAAQRGSEPESERKRLQRYESGANPIPASLWPTLRAALQEHRQELGDLIRKLRS